MTAVRYDMEWPALGLSAHLSIFAADGTVTIVTAGVEMGQGLYMKASRDSYKKKKEPLLSSKSKRNLNSNSSFVYN